MRRSSENAPAVAAANDEYDVYSALINDIYVKEKVKLIVITNPTCCDSSTMDLHSDSWRILLEELKPLSRDTLEVYASRNMQQVELERKFQLRAKYQVVPYSTVKKILTNIDFDEAWRRFYSRYPASGGYIRLSRVGFNKTSDQALVSTAWMCNTLCGEGNFVVLVKQGGLWKVQQKVVTWVS